MTNTSGHDSSSIAEIAALTARLRELSQAGRAADPDEVDRFLADKQDLLDRITAGDVVDHTGSVASDSADNDAADRDPDDSYRTYTPAEASEALTNRGVAADDAADRVERYLSDLTERCGWEPEDGWQIDHDDLAAILDPPPPHWAGTLELAIAEGDVPTFGPDDAELDELHAGVEAARTAGEAWHPSGAREQWRERDEPGPDGRRWELRDVTDESSAVADAYGSTYRTGYEWWTRETDPTAEHGMTGAEGDPISSRPVLSAESAAQALAARDGRPIDQARADVTRYLDDVSELLGTPAHEWGLDDADLDALGAPGGDGPRPQAADAAAGTAAGASDALAEDERRDQLIQWHDDDTTADEAAVADLDCMTWAPGDEATP